MNEHAFPPCINNTIDEIQQGGNPPHRARFTLAAFLLETGWSVEDIVTLFEPVRDYSEKTTRYQASNIDKEGYLPPNCDRLAKDRLCPVAKGDSDDNLCKQGWMTNPLSYYNAKE